MNLGEENNPLVFEMEDVNGEKVKLEIDKYFEDGDNKYITVNDLDDGESAYIFEVISVEQGVELRSVDEDEFARLVELVNGGV